MPEVRETNSRASAGGRERFVHVRATEMNELGLGVCWARGCGPADSCPAAQHGGGLLRSRRLRRAGAFWLHLVTPVNASVARPLVEGLKSPTVAREERLRRLLPFELTPFDEAATQAFTR